MNPCDKRTCGHDPTDLTVSGRGHTGVGSTTSLSGSDLDVSGPDDPIPYSVVPGAGETIQGQRLPVDGAVTPSPATKLWPGQEPGVHDHKPYDDCYPTCPGNLLPIIRSHNPRKDSGIWSLPDSGERRQFTTGSQRDEATGKGRYDLLPPEGIKRVAQRFEDGASKYEDRNWEKGQPLGVFLDSALRHVFATLAGDQTEDHPAAAAWNLLCFIATYERIVLGTLPATLDDIGITT